MDRMPKEYKIAVYLISIGLLFYLIFAYTIYFRFKVVESNLSTPILLILSVIFLPYLFGAVLLVLKKKSSLTLLKILVVLSIVVNIGIMLISIFFKEFATVLSNQFKIGTFTPYLFLGIIRATPNKLILSSSLLLPWQVYFIYLLSHKETKDFIETKTYPLVNTQVFTLGVLILYFITIALVFKLFGV